MPLFSIIIPTLNEEKYLPLLLQDLTQKPKPNLEVIIVDGNSEDQTVAQAQTFKSTLPQLTILQSSKRNISHQRNLGAQKARGKYILFMDADNRLPNFFLDGLYYHIRNTNPDVFTCWCQADTTARADKTIATLINLTMETAHLLNSPSALGALIGCSQETFRLSQGFDPQIAFAEDDDFIKRCHRLNLNYHIFRDPKFVYSLRRFRQNGRLKMFHKYASLHLKRLLKHKIDFQKEYPTGGQIFTDNDNSQNLKQKLETGLRDLSQKPQVANKIKHLLQVILDEG